MRRRKRGKAGGIKKRLQRRKCRPYLPSVIMGNVRSIRNKTDELLANTRYMSEFRNISIMSFTETWLKETDTDDHVHIDGFKLLRGDRILSDAQKSCGGGLCVYINEKWCHPNNAVMKFHTCSPNLEILTVSMRPYYLPREFNQVIYCTVYIPDRSVAKAGAEELCQAIHDIERTAPNAVIIINGDFNHATLKKSSVHYYQHVTFPTRDLATLDLFYSNVKDAYSSKALPPLGQADHSLVLMTPKYRPLAKRLKLKVITI